MKVELNSIELLNLLDCLLSKYVDFKPYYDEHCDEEDFEGVVLPEEIATLYNKILTQAQKEDECKSLKPIGQPIN